MPYRQAHWFVLAIFPLAALAFWPGYLAQFSTSPIQMHLHGVTATLWLALLAGQSWTIHHGDRNRHRLLGWASLALFPLFLAGGAGIFLGMARHYDEASSPFYTLYAPRLAWIDVVSVLAFAAFYHEGLRLRRHTQLHARYLLATALFLLPPILGRLAPLLPPLAIEGPQDFWKLGIAFQLGNGVSVAIALALAATSGRHARPFLLAAGAVLLAALLFQFAGSMAWWLQLLTRLASVPPTALSLVAAVAGAGIAFSGWTTGEPRERRAVA